MKIAGDGVSDTMRSEGYERQDLNDPSFGNDLKKANRRWGRICADSKQAMVAGFNAQGNAVGDKPGLPLADGLNFYED